MPNEVMRLEFMEYSTRDAEEMLAAGRDFALSRPGGRAGPRHGTVTTYVDGMSIRAYWTPGRVLVVRVESMPRDQLVRTRDHDVMRRLIPTCGQRFYGTPTGDITCTLGSGHAEYHLGKSPSDGHDVRW